jgi:hypothetical protein
VSEASQPYDRRRVARVSMRVPVELRWTANNGVVTEENTYTGSIGVLGAMVRISYPLKMGTEVTITNRFSQQTAKFQVVWLEEKPGDSLWEIGFESTVPLNNFWGVRFPSSCKPVTS